MCFSEPASFGLAATLTPAGIYGIDSARRFSVRHTLLACFPISFAAQQAIEGVVWHGINHNNANLVFFGARGFVFFSHFFWLFFVPLAAYALETVRNRKTILGFLVFIGALYGASLFVPLALESNRLTVEVVRGSIEYNTVLIYDGFVGRQLVRVFYSVVIASSLLISSHRELRWFGAIIVASVLIAYWLFDHAFISVWCFLAAATSLYVVYIMFTLRRDAWVGRKNTKTGNSTM